MSGCCPRSPLGHLLLRRDATSAADRAVAICGRDDDGRDDASRAGSGPASFECASWVSEGVGRLPAAHDGQEPRRSPPERGSSVRRVCTSGSTESFEQDGGRPGCRQDGAWHRSDGDGPACGNRSWHGAGSVRHQAVSGSQQEHCSLVGLGGRGSARGRHLRTAVRGRRRAGGGRYRSGSSRVRRLRTAAARRARRSCRAASGGAGARRRRSSAQRRLGRARAERDRTFRPDHAAPSRGLPRRRSAGLGARSVQAGARERPRFLGGACKRLSGGGRQVHPQAIRRSDDRAVEAASDAAPEPARSPTTPLPAATRAASDAGFR